MYHYKNLAPLYGKTVEFKQYVCPHDNWLFNQSDNLKLHNKVRKFEQAVATEIEKRYGKLSVEIEMSWLVRTGITGK